MIFKNLRVTLILLETFASKGILHNYCVAGMLTPTIALAAALLYKIQQSTRAATHAADKTGRKLPVKS